MGVGNLQVRVNDELMLDAGTCAANSDPSGPTWIIRPPADTLFQQVLAYLRDKPDPPKRPSGSMVGREGVAAAALVLRWGSYLAVLLDHDKPVWPEVNSPATSPLRSLRRLDGAGAPSTAASAAGVGRSVRGKSRKMVSVYRGGLVRKVRTRSRRTGWC